MDENNHYGQVMTKPLPMASIKEEKHVPSWKNSHIRIKKVSTEDEIGHVFVVDVDFDGKKASKRQLICF